MMQYVADKQSEKVIKQEFTKKSRGTTREEKISQKRR